MMTNNNESPKAPEKMSYVEWMIKIKSVHYANDSELDKGIAKDMQYNLSNSK